MLFEIKIKLIRLNFKPSKLPMVKKYSQPEKSGNKAEERVSTQTLLFLLNFSKSLDTKKLKKKTIILHNN